MFFNVCINDVYLRAFINGVTQKEEGLEIFGAQVHWALGIGA